MLLYHFTAVELLESIMREGLTRGDVPLTPTTSRTGVWLTTLYQPDNPGQGGGSLPSPAMQHPQLKELSRPEDTEIPPPNKLAVRITVSILSSDRRLDRWMRWAPRHLELTWFHMLNELGGGPTLATTWWIYWGIIPPQRFIAVDILDPAVTLCRNNRAGRPA